MAQIGELTEAVIRNVERVIVGKRNTIGFSLVTMLCEGHLLLEDVPGVAKTMLARALAVSVGCKFSRVQCTPDLLPSDVTGVSVFNQKTQDFEFRPGPVMSQIVLADEINRATPRAQAALLESMAERQLTIDGTTYALPRPFMVIATQNPVEHEGTFPLPEAQLDRFTMKLSMGYPGQDEELALFDRIGRRHPIEDLKPVCTPAQLQDAQAKVCDVTVEHSVRQYIVQLVQETRVHPMLDLGVSPRGTLVLFRAAQALAALRKRDYVIPDDVKQVAWPVLQHRIILKSEAVLRKQTPGRLLRELLSTVPAPVVA